MSGFNKKEYDVLYNRSMRKNLNFGMSLSEYDYFVNACEKIGVERSFYIKALINADLIQRGFKPIFIDGRTHKTVLLSTDTQNQVDNKNV